MTTFRPARVRVAVEEVCGETVQQGLDGSDYVVVDGDVCGHFAVHRSVGGEGYTVTHVPTGRAAAVGLTRAEAQAAVSVLLTTAHDWARADLAYYEQPAILEMTRAAGTAITEIRVAMAKKSKRKRG